MNTAIRYLGLLALILAWGCTPHPGPGVKEVKAEEAGPVIASGAQAVDANGENFRKENGIIAGAVLLSSTSAYKLEELPADKASRLVFYCANRL